MSKVDTDNNQTVVLNESEIKNDWSEFYKKNFDIEINLSALSIPAPKEGFIRCLIVIPGVNLGMVLMKIKSFMGVVSKKYDHYLDDFIIHNDRDAEPGNPYAIWVRDAVEADEEHTAMSYNDVQEEKISGETFLERLLHGLKYFLETGEHLDCEGATLCSGSRSENDVPTVKFEKSINKLDIYGYYLKDGFGDMSIREISC